MHSEIRKRPEGALLRTYLQAAGVAPESISKPMIGVVTASTQVFSERPQAKDLGDHVVSGVQSVGGIAVRWDTVRTPDLMSWGHSDGYSFAWRDQLADFIESWSKQQALDGLVFVGDSQETLAGMVMAAARLNLPAVLVTAGAPRWEFKMSGEPNGKKNVSMPDPFELLSDTLYAKKKSGSPADVQLDRLNACLIAQENHSTYAFDLVLEALGVTLPGVSTSSAGSTHKKDLAVVSGKQVIALIQAGAIFKRFLSINAFTNAIRLNAALGGSIDVVIHLMALAHEVGLSLPLDLFEKISKETPQLCRLGGVGEKEPHRIEDLDRAGGVWAVMHALKSQILPTTTINGKGAAELAKVSSIQDSQVIRMNKPYAKQSGLGVLRGNLAPKGAIFTINQIPPSVQSIQGAAVIFENEVDAAQAVSQGKIKKGTVMVIRGQGPRGGPGLKKLRILPALIESRGLNKTLAVITDGRFPDSPSGIFISTVAPESVVSGPLAVLKEGDVIEINIANRTLGVRLTEMDIRIRLSRWQAPDTKGRRGFLDRYSRLVSEANEGAVLK
ncbi:MAG: dihydroxy-acid dehydratase [Elusimicrobiota bacterium]